MLKFKEITISNLNIRTEAGDVSDIENSIKDIGLLYKIIFRNNKGNLELLAGLRRYSALRNLRGEEGILEDDEYFIMEDLSDKRAALISITENQRRKNFSPFELNKAILLLNSLGYKSKDITSYLGITPHRMKRLEALGHDRSRMPDKVIEELSKNPDTALMSDMHWFHIANNTDDPDVIKDTVDFILEHETSPREVPSILKSIEKNYKQDNIDPDSMGGSGNTAALDDDPVNANPTVDSPIEYTHKGELILERHGDVETFKVLGKEEDQEVPVEHYMEFLRHPEKFKCYVTFKLKVMPVS
jgi:ParB-like chromosome segregation protein Spo0J